MKIDLHNICFDTPTAVGLCSIMLKNIPRALSSIIDSLCSNQTIRTPALCFFTGVEMILLVLSQTSCNACMLFQPRVVGKQIQFMSAGMCAAC